MTEHLYHCPICVCNYVGDGEKFKEYMLSALAEHLSDHSISDFLTFVLEEAEDLDNNYRVRE